MGLPLPPSDLLAPWCFLVASRPEAICHDILSKKEHFELMHTQMECKEHGKISLKSLSKLTDAPMFKSTMSMLKQICNFKSYLSTHYGVEGFPLDYVMQPKLTHIPWHTMQPQNLRRNVYNAFPDFFQVDKNNYNSCHFE